MTKVMTIDDPCTCGSGLPVRYCCYKEINTKPTGPKTNYSHPKCYARSLGDCSENISKEHYFSRSVLDLFGKTAKMKTPFIQGDGAVLNLSSLYAYILCERHNNALSPLDNLAKKFFEFALRRTEYQYLIIRGVDLERWMLKLMCGVIATGYGQTVRGNLIVGLEPPRPVLETLFGSLEIPKDYGLVIPKKKGVTLPDQFGFTIFEYKNKASGCAFSFSYIQLILILRSVPKLKLTDMYHRPSAIGYTVDDEHREVYLGWPEGPYVDLSFAKSK